MFSSLINAFVPRSQAATVQTLGHPAAGVVGWFGGPESSSGVVVNEHTALTFSAVWCATKIISETLATLPCILYRRTSDDSRERATDDPRYFLMHDEPHPSIAPVTFFECMTGHLVLWGNAYARIVGNQFGDGMRLEPLMPDMVDIQVEGDTIRYIDRYSRRTLEAREVLHIPSIGSDCIRGWSVIRQAANSIGGGMAAENRANGQFRSGAMPGGLIVHPMRLTKEARESLRRDWNEIHEGSEKAGRVGILHGGMDFKPLTMSNEDAQFLQSRKFSIEEIARWFRVPLHMLAHLENSSVRANIEQQAIEFIVYSMGPWLTRWQQQLNRKLLAPPERPTLYFEFLLDALLKGDVQSRYAAYATARQWGWMSVNDILKSENRNALPEGGDVYLQPANMVPAGTVPTAATNDLQQNLAASLAEVVEHARQLRADLASSTNSVFDLCQSSSDHLDSALRSLHEDREAIKRDIENIGKTAQAQGYIAEREQLTEVALGMFREQLGCCVRVEKAEAIKAARRQQEHGESFLKWMEGAYLQLPRLLLERTHGCVACWERASGLIETDWPSRWVEASKADLLAATDGDPDKFVERVQCTIDGWDERVKTAVPA